MSDYLCGRVWQSGLDGDLKPLAAALANCGLDDGTSIYPSIAYLAWKLSRCERAIQYGMEKLKSLGVIVVLKNGKGGRSKVPDYRLMEDALPARPKWESPQIGNEKGAVCDEKGAIDDTKGCNLEQERVQVTTERVQPIAPDLKAVDLKAVEQVGDPAPETGAALPLAQVSGHAQPKPEKRQSRNKTWPSRQRFQKERPYVQEVPKRSPAEERRERTAAALGVLRDPGRLPENVRRVLAQK